MEKRIRSFQNQAEAEMAEQLLLSHGFHPRPVNESAHIFVAGGEQFYDIWVPVAEEKKAKVFLKEFGHGDSRRIK